MGSLKDRKPKAKSVEREDRKILGGGKTKFNKQVDESSKQYLLRQAKDPYVRQAIQQGYHSRAAFKLIQVNEKVQIIKPGMNVVDLGAAPGGWCQVLKEIMGDNGKILALDKIWMEDVEGVDFIKGDFTEGEVYEELMEKCPEKVDVVLSDMAPETSGHTGNDHLRIMGLAEMAVDFAFNVLKPNGTFLTKLFQGGEEVQFRDDLRKRFSKVQFIKPPSSRKDSVEIFLLCTGFKG